MASSEAVTSKISQITSQNSLIKTVHQSINMHPIEEEGSSLKSEEFICHVKAASIPTTVKVPSKAQLQPQISAPSYLSSLKENDAPPFKLQPREIRPVIVEGTFVTEQDAVDLIAATEADPINGFRKFLEKLLLEKEIIQNYALSERKYLVSLLRTTVDYAAQRDFSARKLACLMTIYLKSHVYFKNYYWTAPRKLWDYFVELVIRHTIVDSPDGCEVFEPDESYDIVTHFHTIYVNNLPLIHIVVFGVYRLKFLWPFKRK